MLKFAYEVYDIEELEIQDSMILTCYDVYRDTLIEIESIDKQVVKLMMLTKKFALITTVMASLFKDLNYGAIEQNYVELDAVYTRIKFLE
ncbi:MAG: hypothetical protein ACTS78_03870 [Arsenophonus sp. NC-WZS1-MAG3]